MVPKESFSPEAWLRKGDVDLESARVLLREDHATTAAFLLQQALEKYLKGFLLSKGWALRKVHELDVLLNDAVHYDKNLEKFRDLCETATEYYLAERYPYEEPVSVSKTELEAQLRQAGLLREALRL